MNLWNGGSISYKVSKIRAHYDAITHKYNLYNHLLNYKEVVFPYSIKEV